MTVRLSLPANPLAAKATVPGGLSLEEGVARAAARVARAQPALLEAVQAGVARLVALCRAPGAGEGPDAVRLLYLEGSSLAGLSAAAGRAAIGEAASSLCHLLDAACVPLGPRWLAGLLVHADCLALLAAQWPTLSPAAIQAVVDRLDDMVAHLKTADPNTQ